MLGVFRFAFAEARTALPGGGSVVIPSPCKTRTDYPNYAKDIDDALPTNYDKRGGEDGAPRGAPDRGVLPGLSSEARRYRFTDERRARARAQRTT
jgi:hypothetical protein